MGVSIPFPPSSPRLLLVDGYGLIYRAFYAIPHLNNSRKEPTNAIYGFFKMLRKNLRELGPSHVGIVMDEGEPLARLKQLPTYKLHRKPMPDDLRPQIAPIKEIVPLYGMHLLGIEAVEADDIIATLAEQSQRQHLPVSITTSDKDLMQLVNGNVEIRDPSHPEKRFDTAAVRERYGVDPSQICDFLSFIGDNVDNIPGIPGIGPKTAQSLLLKFGNIDEVLKHLDELPTKAAAALREHAERLAFNRNFVRLDREVPVPWTIDSLKRKTPDYTALDAFLLHCEFKKIREEIAEEARQLTTPELSFDG